MLDFRFLFLFSKELRRSAVPVDYFMGTIGLLVIVVVQHKNCSKEKGI